MVGKVPGDQMDGVTGRVTQGGAQDGQEVPAGAAAEGVDPGEGLVHRVRSTGEHVVRPAVHLERVFCFTKQTYT